MSDVVIKGLSDLLQSGKLTLPYAPERAELKVGG